MLALSCSSSDPTITLPDPTPIVFGQTAQLGFSSSEGARADSPVDDPGNDPIAYETLGVYGISQNDITIFEPTTTTFYYTLSQAYKTKYKEQINGNWPTHYAGEWLPKDNHWAYADIKYWSGSTIFQFYCYSPHESQSTTNNTKVRLLDLKYGFFQSFEFINIPPYSNVPYMVADEVVSQRGGTVTFHMKHLSSRICINFKIGKEYSHKRRVCVKKVLVADREAGTAICYNCMVKLKSAVNPNTEISITQGDAYNPVGTDGNISLIPIFDNKDGLELRSDTWQQFGSLYAISGDQKVPNITLTVVYDVYDKTNNNTPVRLDQRVSNTVIIQEKVEPSKYYNVNITISPAYLYVLSDNDVKPDILIEPESNNITAP